MSKVEYPVIELLPDKQGHVFEMSGPEFRPCKGCECSSSSEEAKHVCPTPYSSPVAMYALLVEVRDLLARIAIRIGA